MTGDFFCVALTDGIFTYIALSGQYIATQIDSGN
jgi:hypothetical protein